MTATLLMAALNLVGTARGLDEFIALLRKAEGRQEPDERIVYFTRAIAAWTPAHSRELLANCFFGRGEARYVIYDFTAALPDLDKVLEADPRHARAYLLRGRIRLHQARSDEAAPETRRRSAVAAAADLAEYAALRPEDLSGLLALGRAQSLAGADAQALRTFARARQMAPADPRPQLGTALVYMAMRDMPRARQRMDEASALARGRDADVLTERAQLLAALGESGPALADLDLGLPMLEDILSDMSRSHAHPADIAERQSAAGRAYYARGSLKEASRERAAALADYQAGCGHGHQPCCRRAQALAAQPRPRPSARPRRTEPPHSDPGDRIYAN